MNPELIERMEELAKWHDSVATLNNYTNFKPFHTGAAADIRAAIVSADDATKNLLTFRHHLAERRKYAADPEAITGFDELQEGSS
jgi:hypothetical protein